MNDSRETIYQWVQGGFIPAHQLRAALEVAGAFPDAMAWRRFLMRLAFAMGFLLLAVGIIYFIAFNWHDMPRPAKFALVEGALVALVVTAWMSGVDSLAGRAALCAAAGVTGGLLALMGQVYQTGADTYDLFAAWAVAILPWVLVGRQAPVWLLWLAVVNGAVALYQARLGWMGDVDTGRAIIWTLFAVNTVALAGVELARRWRWPEWQSAWAQRCVGLASGVAATVLGLQVVMDHGANSGLAGIVYAVWLLVLVRFYRHVRLDLFMLAGLVLSAIIVITGLLARVLSDYYWLGGSFLLMAAAVVGMATWGAVWLKRIGAGEPG